MDVIFLDFRCVNLILNDVKGANTSGKLLLIFLVIYYYHYYIFLFQHRVYETAAVSTVNDIRSQIIGINIRKVNTVNEPKKRQLVIII